MASDEGKTSNRDIFTAIKEVATKNVISPLQWLAGIAGGVALLGGPFAPPPMNYILYAVFVIALLYALWVYDTFRRTDPKMLQSEDYRIEQQKVDLLIDDRNRGNREILDATPVANNHFSTAEGGEI